MTMAWGQIIWAMKYVKVFNYKIWILNFNIIFFTVIIDIILNFRERLDTKSL